MDREEVIEVLEAIIKDAMYEEIGVTQIEAITQAISMIKENAELRKEKAFLEAGIELNKETIDMNFKTIDKLQQELTELKAKYEELEYDWDCKSGNENCDGYNEKGFPCYRHLTDSSERLEQELDDLKKAVASEGLGVAEIAKALMDKAMEWYPYGDKIPMPKQCELLAKAIHEAQTKYKKELRGGE